MMFLLGVSRNFPLCAASDDNRLELRDGAQTYTLVLCTPMPTGDAQRKAEGRPRSAEGRWDQVREFVRGPLPPSRFRLPLPPFTLEKAIQKVRLAEDAWNSRDATTVSNACTEDTQWRSCGAMLSGRAAVQASLESKWAREQDYRLIMEYWAHTENRVAVRFAYEFYTRDGQWHRAYGNENWEFDKQGMMAIRHASFNETTISEADRQYRWPLGRRPDDHPSLSDLGL